MKLHIMCKAAQKSHPNIKQLEPQQKYCRVTISYIKLLGGGFKMIIRKTKFDPVLMVRESHVLFSLSGPPQTSCISVTL